MKQDESEIFKTKSGRIVYGGGGIMPDIFVAHDTTGYSDYYADIVSKNLINKFSFRFVDSRRSEMSTLATAAEIEAYLDRSNVLNLFYDYAQNNGVKRDYTLNEPARKQIKSVLYGTIIYDSLDMEDYVAFYNLTDITVQRAVQVLSEN